MNKIVLFSFIALSIYGSAEEVAMSNSSSQMSNDSSQMTNNTMSQDQIVTLTSAAPDSNNGWYLFGDLLYWHADVDNADWAFKNTNTAAVGVAGPNHSLEFKWSYGFRVGIGANMDYDQWDTNVYYTWFQTENSNALGTSGSQVGWDQFGLATEFSQGKINWRIHYSMIDWELGRWFFVSEKLALRPHVGLKNGWISQKIREEFTKATGTHTSDTSNEFWGVGPSGGLNTTWTFAIVNTHNFSFFGDFAGALMYGHFDVKHKEVGVGTPDAVDASFKPSGLDRNLMVPMLQGMFGVSWDTSFNHDRCHFGLRVGYELQYWFRQNQMLITELFPSPTVSEAVVSYSRSNGGLALQGLTFDLRFDF